MISNSHQSDIGNLLSRVFGAGDTVVRLARFRRPARFPIAPDVKRIEGPPRLSGMTGTAPRALVWATDIDVLPHDSSVERRDDFLVVRSPSNPNHHWGNLLVFDREPAAGDRARWEALFDETVGTDPRVRHRTFAWDRSDGTPGAAREEFAAHGYSVEETYALVAEQLHPHPREIREVLVRELDPAPGADEELWDAVVELQVADRDEGYDEEPSRTFHRAWIESRRALFRTGRGAWYLALDPATGALAGSCGIVVTHGRSRFQMVITAPGYRRRGVCSRLVVEAAQRAVEAHGAERLVIVADADSHALGLYESLGFERREHCFGVCWWPRGT
jgi:ribosomal protein S18 acetylase RimI-like enzyme